MKAKQYQKINNVCDKLPDDLGVQVKSVKKAAGHLPWQEGLAKLKEQSQWRIATAPGRGQPAGESARDLQYPATEKNVRRLRSPGGPWMSQAKPKNEMGLVLSAAAAESLSAFDRHPQLATEFGTDSKGEVGLDI